MPCTGYEAVDEQRWVDEPPKRAGRTSFARDRARVLHSAAWRRLAAKTQVMIAGEGDFPRTRMTHSLECAQVGRELGASLGCDPDLVEAACLAHDLGHPPFGHNGEDALDEVAEQIGGFEGNAQTLRILTRLEAKAFGSPGRAGWSAGLGWSESTAGPAGPGGAGLSGGSGDRSLGLNLTRATLDAATKYPWPRRDGSRKFGVYAEDLEVFHWLREGARTGTRSFEAQVMDWSDDVAYCVHDVEDGIHGQHIDLAALRDPQTQADLASLVADQYLPGVDPAELVAALERLVAAPFWPASYRASLRDLAALKDMTSHLIGRFTTAAEVATKQAHGPGPLARYRGWLVVPEPVRHEVGMLKGIANLFVMQRTGSEQAYDRQRRLIQDLASALLEQAPRALEPHFRPAWEHGDESARLRVVVDQVASLTDTSVVIWHRRLCG